MGHYHAQRSVERMLDASQLWKEVALLSDGAVFARKPVWTLPYLQDLKQYFIDQPEEGKDSFFIKLEKQLAATELGVKQLAAEMLWVMYLCPDTVIRASTKRMHIRRVWEWSGEPFPENSDCVKDNILGGAGNPGQGFLNHRPYDLEFFIHLMIAFKRLAESERIELLSDGWKFGKWLEKIPGCNDRQFRNMIMFLLFPDDFEHIFARTKRREIVQKFTGKTEAEVWELSALEIDQELLNIRREKEKEYGTRDLDFYASPLRDLWQDPELENGPERDQGDPKPEVDTMRYPLNQILYGPPGTGKTWNTVNYAVAIIEDKSLDKIKEDKDARQRFDKLKEDGQIEMVTFHQNFTYEDFIEGIRPVLADDESKNIEYKLHKGVFREIVERAKTGRNPQTGDKSWDMDELLQAFAKSIKKRLESGEEINLFPPDHRSGATIKQINWSADDKFQSFRLGGTRKSGRLAKDVIKRDYEAFCEGEIKSRTDIRPTRGSKQTEHERARYLFPLFQMIKQFHDEEWQSEESIPVEKQNYVLIIDEINRGNIAKIFGELITLIESSKRIGEDDEATVILPYSQDSFGMPDNLYIIGTMNTADRSIALLDTALRRRFDFVEMMPDSKHDRISTDIEGVDCQELLAAMNKRIRFLLDREHQIGHTYFMGVDDLESLEATFKNKIIPLLQEYFYDNWEKIDLVLNKNGFIQKIDIPEDLRGSLVDDNREVYELLSFDREGWKKSESYQMIYEETGEGDNDGTE